MGFPLISKIEKMALIPVMALCLSSGLKAQKESGVNVYMEYIHGKIERPAVQPGFPALNSSYSDLEHYMKNKFSITLEPYLREGRFMFGMNITNPTRVVIMKKFHYTNNFNEVSDFVLRKDITAGIGTSFAFYRKESPEDNFEISIQSRIAGFPYQVKRRDFEYTGGSSGNNSYTMYLSNGIGVSSVSQSTVGKRLRSENLSSGLGYQFQVGIGFAVFDKDSGSSLNAGFNMEKYGNEYSIKGFYISSRISF